MSKLYVVPTPIGNLEDMTFRAIRVLNEVEMILAEDTRTSSVLMKHYDIRKPLKAFHKFNEHAAVSRIADEISMGKSIALISDAGTPAISDPGFLLVRECVARSIEIETLPGATAFVPALVNSGLPTDRFCFEGFLPQKKGKTKLLTELSQEQRTIVLYESPHRVVKTLMMIAEIFTHRPTISLSREISKRYEQTIRGKADELIEYFAEHEPKGEFVMVVEGNSTKPLKREGNKYELNNK